MDVLQGGWSLEGRIPALRPVLEMSLKQMRMTGRKGAPARRKAKRCHQHAFESSGQVSTAGEGVRKGRSLSHPGAIRR